MRRFLQVLCLALTVVFLPAVACVAQYSDIRATFLASNPNGGWEYGFINEDNQFVAYNTTFDDGKGIAGWCLDNTPGPMGAITVNYSDEPIDRYGVRWEPGQICVLTPLAGMSVVIRWHAQAAETVRVDASLSSQSSDVAMNVKIVGNGTDLSSSRITSASAEQGLPGDSAVSLASVEPEGSDKANCSTTTTVGRNDTIDLVITSDIEHSAGHVTTFLNIDRVGLTGISLEKATLGKRTLGRQAMLFGQSLLSGGSEFDSLVGRG